MCFALNAVDQFIINVKSKEPLENLKTYSDLYLFSDLSIIPTGVGFIS